MRTPARTGEGCCPQSSRALVPLVQAVLKRTHGFSEPQGTRLIFARTGVDAMALTRRSFACITLGQRPDGLGVGAPLAGGPKRGTRTGELGVAKGLRL
eukprot:6255246-Prymnesium_polylepis.1